MVPSHWEFHAMAENVSRLRSTLKSTACEEQRHLVEMPTLALSSPLVRNGDYTAMTPHISNECIGDYAFIETRLHAFSRLFSCLRDELRSWQNRVEVNGSKDNLNIHLK